MAGKSHSRATKLAAVFLARESGVDAAADAFGIDRNTIRRWLAAVELPADQWEAIQEVLLARGSELAAKGQTAGLTATLTGAGIASRNVRYGKLIERRDARKADQAAAAAGPEKTASELAIHALPVERKRWLRDFMALHIDLNRYRHPDQLPPDPETGTGLSDERRAEWVRFIEWSGTAPLAELDAKVEKVMAQIREAVTGYTVSKLRITEGRYEYRVFDGQGQHVLQASNLPPEFAHLPVLDDTPPSGGEINVTPAPASAPALTISEAVQPVSAPRERTSYVVTAGDRDHPTWRPWDG